MVQTPLRHCDDAVSDGAAREQMPHEGGCDGGMNGAAARMQALAYVAGQRRQHDAGDGGGSSGERHEGGLQFLADLAEQLEDHSE